MSSEFWHTLSSIVTVIGLPLAIYVFLYEQRRARDNEEGEVYQLLSDSYQDFLEVALANSDLRLFSAEKTPALSDEQKERMLIIFSMLISLFERAYLLLHEEHMTPKRRKRWLSWEDYIREWCQRADFRALLPTLLRGEDEEFVAYVHVMAAQEELGDTASDKSAEGSAA